MPTLARAPKAAHARRALAAVFVAALVTLGLGACADNQDASRRCAQKGVATGEECKACCAREGANGYTYIDDRCACVGDRK